MAGSQKNARRRKAWIFFQDESGVSQRPSIHRTWAPKGKTPVLIHAFNWSKMSICAAMGYRWDGLPAHKSRTMKEYLQSQRNWLTVERLPGYAPELNPVETLCGNIKGQELANRCAQDLAELDKAVRGGMARVKQSRTLPLAFLKHAGLSF